MKQAGVGVFFAMVLAGCFGTPEPFAVDSPPESCILGSTPGLGAPACVVFFKDAARPAWLESEAGVATHPEELGVVLVTWIESGDREESWVRVAASSDGGGTWHRQRLEPQLSGPLPLLYSAWDATPLILSNGKMLVLFRDLTRTAQGVSVDDRLVLASSLDQGRTWSLTVVWRSPQDGCLAAHYPHLAAAPTGDKVYAVAQDVSCPGLVSIEPGTCQSRCVWMWTSGDGGRSWGPPVRIPLPASERQGHYSPRLGVGKDGLLVLKTQVLDLVFPVVGGSLPNAPPSMMFATVSRDGGNSWVSQAIAPQAMSSRTAPVMTPDGSVHVFLQDGSRLVLVSSSDHGATWTRPQEIATTTTGEDVGFWLAAAGKADGALAVLLNSDNGCDPAVRARWAVDLAYGTPAKMAVARLAGPLDRRVVPACATHQDDYAGLAFARDGSLWAAWANPADDVTAPGIAVGHWR